MGSDSSGGGHGGGGGDGGYGDARGTLEAPYDSYCHPQYKVRRPSKRIKWEHTRQTVQVSQPLAPLPYPTPRPSTLFSTPGEQRHHAEPIDGACACALRCNPACGNAYVQHRSAWEVGDPPPLRSQLSSCPSCTVEEVGHHPDGTSVETNARAAQPAAAQLAARREAPDLLATLSLLTPRARPRRVEEKIVMLLTLL